MEGGVCMECFAVKDLSFRYKGETEYALKDICFSVRKGEFLTICGLSGCGKSTLLRHLKPCLQPVGECSGEILFEGVPVGEMSLKEQASKIGFVSQSPDHQSITDKVWHELSFGPESLGLKQDVIQRRAAETASFFGIEKWFEKPVAELSGGQKQLLNIAAAMVLQPSVLILDEPTAQLDPIAAMELLNWLKRINRELAVTIIMSEHNLEEVCSCSDRLLVMSDGKLLSYTAPAVTSDILYQNHDPMFLSMPSVARIFEYCETTPETAAPLSVSDGRKWLRERIAKDTPKELPPETPPAFPPYISIKNLWFRYDKNGADILKGCTLDIRKGEFLAIIGGNGCGKTTLFSVLAGVNAPIRGSVTIGKKPLTRKNVPTFGIALLPQDPQTLFVENTVMQELTEVLRGLDISESEKDKRMQSVITLCSLQHLLQRHPFDLSGGEQQRAALAKLLLTEPEILLLDEPTKGLDCAFRHELAHILRQLTASGTTVAAVSHDVDFCACYADRCGMLFNGRMVSLSTPRTFFSDNGLYTTSVSRMTKGMICGAVTAADALKALGAEQNDFDFHSTLPPKQNGRSLLSKSGAKKSSEHQERKDSHKFRWIRRITGSISLLASVVLMLSTANLIRLPFLSENLFLSFGLLAFFTVSFLLTLGNKRTIPLMRTKGSLRVSALTAVTIFILVPLTIFFGVRFLDDSKYLFISLLILLESIAPFYFMFEKHHIRTRELVLTAALCALCVAGRGIFYMLPECKPVTAIVILCGASLGSESGFMIGSVSMLASNIIFGQGIWTPWQMVTMGLIGYLSGMVFQKGLLPVSRSVIAVFGLMAVFVIYGGIMNPATLILSRSVVNAQSLLSVYAVGLPLDAVHAVSTAVFLYFGAEPLFTKLERVKKKYGLIR